MTKDQTIIRELRQKNNIQSETIGDYANFFRWLYQRIELHKENLGEIEMSAIVKDIEDRAWGTSLGIKNRIEANGKDLMQKKI